jgi:hypothetical protein
MTFADLSRDLADLIYAVNMRLTAVRPRKALSALRESIRLPATNPVERCQRVVGAEARKIADLLEARMQSDELDSEFPHVVPQPRPS